ncbi:hypothetical protein Tco_0154789 [Tanacetum coccineum]
MAGERRVLTLGGKGSCLSPASVFEFTTANPPQIMKTDPSILARLSSSPPGHKLKSPSALFKLQLTLLTLLLLNNDAQTFTPDLEFYRQDDIDL